jgi:hypothetical protein
MKDFISQKKGNEEDYDDGNKREEDGDKVDPALGKLSGEAMKIFRKPKGKPGIIRPPE